MITFPQFLQSPFGQKLEAEMAEFEADATVKTRQEAFDELAAIELRHSAKRAEAVKASKAAQDKLLNLREQLQAARIDATRKASALFGIENRIEREKERCFSKLRETAPEEIDTAIDSLHRLKNEVCREWNIRMLKSGEREREDFLTGYRNAITTLEALKCSDRPADKLSDDIRRIVSMIERQASKFARAEPMLA